MSLDWLKLMYDADDAGGGGADDKGTDDKGADDKPAEGGDEDASLMGGKAAGEKGDDSDDGGEPKGDDSAGAPETYTEFKVPDGANIDADRLAAAQTAFKEANLSQDQAQAVVDMEIKELDKKRQEWVATSKKWQDELKKDKDLGGAELPKSIERVRGLVQRIAGDDLTDLREFFDSTGYGNYPPLFRTLHKLAMLISEDALPGKSAPAPSGELSEQDKLRRDYPSMFDSEGKPLPTGVAAR